MVRGWGGGGRGPTRARGGNATAFCVETLTGKEPATSVGAPKRPNEGIAAGPLIRFLEAAGKPLKIEFSEDGWRSRVRTILKGASGQN